MPYACTIELRDLPLAAQIGRYGPGDMVPRWHSLDLSLSIAADLVLIEQDGMAHVFDYDPLVAEIHRLAQDGPYETQERLLTRVVAACAAYPAIDALEIALRKGPVQGTSGTLGLRVVADAEALRALREAAV